MHGKSSVPNFPPKIRNNVRNCSGQSYEQPQKSYENVYNAGASLISEADFHRLAARICEGTEQIRN